jgi:hypothetical protein
MRLASRAEDPKRNRFKGMDDMKTLLRYLTALAITAVYASVAENLLAEQGCSTDTECMAECPPPADIPELCDGTER